MQHSGRQNFFFAFLRIAQCEWEPEKGRKPEKMNGGTGKMMFSLFALRLPLVCVWLTPPETTHFDDGSPMFVKWVKSCAMTIERVFYGSFLCHCN